MHSVKRTPEPTSLKNNKMIWTKELLEQLEITLVFSKIPKKYTDKYRQKDVKEALNKMYNGLCCYCEGNSNLTSYEEIEHYKPKSKYPELCFEWTNLHQICPRCNNTKKDKWDEVNPILSPTDDIIEEHLHFENILYVYDPKDIRAKNTVIHLQLNKRTEKRIVLYQKALQYKNMDEQSKKNFEDLIFIDKDYPTYKKYLISIVRGEIHKV